MANSTAAAEVLTTRSRRKRDLWKGIKGFAKHEPVGFVCALIIIVFMFVAIFSPMLRPYPENAIVGDRLEAPSASHLFGTDHLGRDVLSRVITGSLV